IVLDLVFFHRRMLWNDLLEQLAQRRDVPLAAAQLVEQAAFDLVGRHFEGEIERPARGDDAHLAVEHDERLADGVDDRMLQLAPAIGAVERIVICHVRALPSYPLYARSKK